MALGEFRNYKSRDKRIKERLTKAGYLKEWKCPKCGRENWVSRIECLRCKTKK